MCETSSLRATGHHSQQVLKTRSFTDTQSIQGRRRSHPLSQRRLSRSSHTTEARPVTPWLLSLHAHCDKGLLAMFRIRNAWLALPVGSGGLFGSGLGIATGHASPLVVGIVCSAAVLLSIIAAVVAIVRIRTSRSLETRRMTALTRLSRKHRDPDRAMRLLTMDKVLGKSEAPTNDQAVSMLSDSPPTTEQNSGTSELKDLVKRVDAGESIVPDVVPDESPGMDDQPGTSPD